MQSHALKTSAKHECIKNCNRDIKCGKKTTKKYERVPLKHKIKCGITHDNNKIMRESKTKNYNDFISLFILIWHAIQ